MARWKALPAELGPEAVAFVAGLRQLKDRGGLDLRQLAARTGYSATSWDRYLNGRTLPPRGAVEAFAEAVGADAVRLLARRELAADAWGRAGAGRTPTETAATESTSTGPTAADVAAAAPAAADREEPGAATPAASAAPAQDHPGSARPDPGPAPRRRVARLGGPRLRLLLTVVVSAALGSGVTALVLRAQPARTAAAAATHKPSYVCDFTRTGGLWYAGNSRTRTAALEVDMWGPEVAELQCLLQHDGFSPGGVDGNFGPLTESAVIAAQKADGLDVDGQVGPATWAALRR
ncbi:peptidoglycan-binding protein [Actinacidiphila sp. bgisy144]|uniref:peptidoglycan-binding protein n=1 Tax=Actinacidiphila sp. bgisy144 TaxID=3413791 RepID=UPI003EBE64D6